jgi:hypothetical protein
MIGGYDDERLTVKAHVWTRAAVAGEDERAGQLKDAAAAAEGRR